MSYLPRTLAQRPFARSGRRLGVPGIAVLVTALICLLGQAASFAHLALVRHASCPEHDALVHTPSGQPSDDVAALPGPGASRIGGLPADGDSHDDDHCLVAGFRRRDLAGLASDPIGPAPEIQPQALIAGDRGALLPAPIPLLSLAPKSSPPAHG